MKARVKATGDIVNASYWNTSANGIKYYDIDNRLETQDFLLAEATWNFIAVINNTMYAKDKLRSVEAKEEHK